MAVHLHLGPLHSTDFHLTLLKGRGWEQGSWGTCDPHPSQLSSRIVITKDICYGLFFRAQRVKGGS